MAVLEEQLQVVLGNWAEGPFSFTGEHYQVQNLDARPKPVQQPHPPLIMGGNAGVRSSALAARFADEYNTPFPTLAEVRERRGRIADACERAGREPIPLSVMTAVIAGADERELRDRVRRVAALTGGDPEALLSAPPASWVIGVVDRAAEQLGALRDAGVSRVMCQHLAHDDQEFIALLGAELAPLVA
jgi:alkanesulfonate monooxygenase SsuD/methylene tetrahydromethanopterin reductase-like flavin-dependent oxidoreductase (luciferase family)